MNDGPGLGVDELRRRLTDLAESVETEDPWDDPLPHVLRAAMADPEPGFRPNPGPFATIRGRVTKIRFNPVPLISVAAAFLVVALIGILIHGGGDDSKKSAESGPGTSAAAAGAAEAQTSAAASVPGDRTGIVPQTSAAGSSACGTLPASSKLALAAPAELAQRGVISVRVTASGGIRLTSPTIVVRLSSGAIVGRLVPTIVTPTPTNSGPVGSFVVTGRLVRTSLSCDDLPGTPPRSPSPLAGSLPAGHYQLVVTGSTRTGRAASPPVAITIHR